jgi:ubiquinone/menaquinone biosynthesis C-methylase UbiE
MPVIWIFSDNQFDVVIISNALRILPDPKQVVSEIKRVLRDGGRIIAPTFMHKSGLKSQLFSRLGRIFGFKAYHRWNEKNYCEFLQKQGLKISIQHFLNLLSQ